MTSIRLIVVVLTLLAANTGSAKEFPAQARLFVGGTSVDPKNLNEEMTTDGFKTFDTLTQFGLEINYPVFRLLSVGLRYVKTYQNNGETTPTPDKDYSVLLDQDAASAVARVPFLKSKFLKMDVFGAVGGSNTTLKFKTSTQDGELALREGGDWFASLQSSVGASVAVGYKSFFFVVEGGITSNKVDSMKSQGTLSSSVRSLDLSGGFVTVGLMFDGITATSK